MEFFPAVLIISLIGGIVSIDTASGWQVMISQPVVACPLIGLLFGYPEIGLTLGILLELPWLVNIPSGGKHGSEGNLGAVTATALSIYLYSHGVNTENIIIIVTILYSLGVSYIGSYFVDYMRQANLMLNYLADKAASEGDLKRISLLNLVGIFYAFILGFLLVGISFSLGIVVLSPLTKFIHQNFDFAFGIAKYGLLGVGVGAVATLFINKETKSYLAITVLISLIIYGLIKILS